MQAHWTLDDIRVWHFDRDTLGRLRLPVLLQTDERGCLKRFRRGEDVRFFVQRRSMLKVLLSEFCQTDPENIRLYTDAFGKPQLQSPAETGVFFNMSHASDMLSIAIGHQPLGIDIEWVDPHIETGTIANGYFSLEERQHIRESANPKQAFFQLWTAKEAYLKATARGLGDLSTAAIRFEEGERMSIQCHPIYNIPCPDSYICHLVRTTAQVPASANSFNARSA